MRGVRSVAWQPEFSSVSPEPSTVVLLLLGLGAYRLANATFRSFEYARESNGDGAVALAAKNGIPPSVIEQS